MAILPLPPTLRQTLDSMQSTVDAVIRAQGKEYGLKEEQKKARYQVDAAQNVGIAIGNARVAYDYQKKLDGRVDKVDPKLRGHLETLKGLVQELTSDDDYAWWGISTRVQEFIQSLPLQAWQTQWTGISSHAFVQYDSFKISFSGLFINAAETRGGYVLTIDNCVVMREPPSSNCLPFKVLTNKAFLPDNAATHFHWFQGTLEVDYNKGLYYLPIYQRAKYVFWGVIAPLNAGRVSLTYPKMQAVEVLKQQFRSATYRITRSDYPGVQGVIDRGMCIKPTPGWKIHSPPKIHAQGVLEDWPIVFGVPDHQWDADEVRLGFSLLAGDAHTELHVEFEESKDVEKKVESNTKVILQWGQSVTIPSETFTAKCEAYDGKELIFAGRDNSKDYFKVVRLRNGDYELKAVAPNF